MGNALLDRIDIREPVKPVGVAQMMEAPGETSWEVRSRVLRAARIQKERFDGLPFNCNARIPPGMVGQFCSLDRECSRVVTKAVERLSLSSRACHSILKVARTIADLEGSEAIGEAQIREAVQHRRYGEEDTFWSYR
jgi:magnesium chelatase family protein